jgi:hypothetical protein
MFSIFERMLTTVPSIYGDQPNVGMSIEAQQSLVGALTIILFVLMAVEFLSPEILFLIALMILCLAQVLNITDTLSGMRKYGSVMSYL